MFHTKERNQMTFALTLDLIFTKANYGEGQPSFITQGHLVRVYSLNKKTESHSEGYLRLYTV